MSDKKASSQAAWALLTCGVSESRVEAHRIRHLVDRLEKLADHPEVGEFVYAILGDVVEGLPSRVDALERTLDRTSYALTKMGQDFLKGRIPVSDRNHVEEAVSATGFVKDQASSESVAMKHHKRVAGRNGLKKSEG